MGSLLAAGAILLGLSSTPATADEYGGCYGQLGSGCVPDNSAHFYCLGASTSGEAAVRDAIHAGMGIMVRDTEMTKSWDTGCDSATDIQFQESGVSTGALGTYQCVTRGTGNRCLKATIIINKDAHLYAATNPVVGSDGTNEAGEVVFNLELSACHEIGHSLGFRHFEAGQMGYYDTHDNDCQRSPWAEIHLSNDGWRQYNGDHVAHINAEF